MKSLPLHPERKLLTGCRHAGHVIPIMQPFGARCLFCLTCLDFYGHVSPFAAHMDLLTCFDYGVVPFRTSASSAAALWLMNHGA